MKILTCKKCDHRVLNTSALCPNCGAVVKQNSSVFFFCMVAWMTTLVLIGVSLAVT